MATQQIQSIGIYHGLPVYPDHIRGLTAVITGANGISGQYMLRVLSRSARWSKIYCLSRRPPAIPGGLPPNAEHIAVDFLRKPEEIAEILKEKNVTADYVFFFAYLQAPPAEGKGLWSDAQEMVRLNLSLLNNFIGAMRIASIKPKRFMLQTGAKNYGMHLGPTKLPQEESDPRVELEPNFYYAQEDSLFQYCKEDGIGWNIVMPGAILGAVPDPVMNLAFPLAIYAAVCAELKQPLEWPSDANAFQMEFAMSSATLNGFMEEWAVLTPAAKNQKFNVCDSSAFTFEALWPQLAGWYGIEPKGPDDNATFIESKTPFNPRPYGSVGVSRRKFTFTEWANKDEVRSTWKTLAERHGLPDKQFKNLEGTFSFLDGAIIRAYTLMFSMNKSRKLGWHGFVDSSESLLYVFDELASLKMIPPVPKVNVWFN